MIKQGVIVLGVLLLILFFISLSRGCKKPAKDLSKETVRIAAPLPCMCSEEERKREGLTFSHVGREVTLNEGQTFVWDRPDGYVAKWCSFRGKVQQLSSDGDQVLRLKATEKNPLIMVRYYTKSY
jgi:hypothetical protein